MDVDVAIVGGGPAGLAAGIAAARGGLSVVILERRAQPLDKACGEGLMPAGLRVLEVLGVQPLIAPADCSRIEGIRYLQEDGTSVQGRLPGGGGMGIRRTALMDALVRRARQAGVTLLERCAPSRVERAPDAVYLDSPAGPVRAQLLVAADGLHSPLRAAQGLEVPAPAAVRRYGLRQHFQLRPWSSLVEVHYAAGVEAYVTPAGAERVGVAFLWEDGRLEGRLSFASLLDRFPALASRLAGAAPDSEARGAGPLEKRVKARTLDRFALLGDAAGYVDAITGEGLSLAFVAALGLGELLPRALQQGATRASLAPYERLYAREFRKYALLTHGLLALARRPALRRGILRFLAPRPRLFEQLLRWAMDPGTSVSLSPRR
jgi:menaquinone-9 beta-reductase